MIGSAVFASEIGYGPDGRSVFWYVGGEWVGLKVDSGDSVAAPVVLWTSVLEPEDLSLFVLLDDLTGEMVGTPFDADALTGLTHVGSDGLTGDEVPARYRVRCLPAGLCLRYGRRRTPRRARQRNHSYYRPAAPGLVSSVETEAVTGFAHLGLRSDGLVMAASSGRINIVDRRLGSVGRTIAVDDVTASPRSENP